MITKNRQTCLSAEMLQQLSHDELSPTELEDIEEHVSGCERCRNLLEVTQSDPQWREEIVPILRTPVESPHAAGDHEDGGSGESLELILRMLGPTDDPQMLGRIGSYEVVGVIGRGGMGVVFKAYEGALNRLVAIKMLLPHLAVSGAARKRFAREGQAAAAVIDDNVMPIYSVAEWQGVPYLVTQYSRGATLQKRIQDQGPLELKEILRIGMQTARGLAAAHAQGLVHRDVKPSNILLDGTVERALLTDFGLARAVDDASITRTGIIAGTPQYMSPEQTRGGSVDARSDLFGLGCVLYAMCTGRPPFRADSSYAILRMITDDEPRSIREVNPDIPEWLCLLISRLMAKSPDVRLGGALNVADLLEQCLAHVQQPTSVPLPASLVPHAAGRRSIFNLTRKRVIAMLGTIGMTLLGMVLWLAPEAPDISGQWTSEEWGTVVLEAKAPGRHDVFAPWDGNVIEVRVENGQTVRQGEIVLALRSDDLDTELVAARNLASVAKNKLINLARERSRAVETGRLDEVTRIDTEIASTEAQRDGAIGKAAMIQKRIEALQIRSPVDGVVATFQVKQNLLDRPVRRGDRLIEVMKSDGPWQYEGTFTGSDKGKSGTVRLQWSRVERRFNGTWRNDVNPTGLSSDIQVNELISSTRDAAVDRSGTISLRLVDKEIRGGWTTDEGAQKQSGTPRLADLVWARDASKKQPAESRSTTTINPEVPANGRPVNKDKLLKELRERDRQFSRRSVEMERTWDTAISPRGQAQQKRHNSMRFGQGDPGVPEGLPDLYQQPHRIRYIWTGQDFESTLEILADLETEIHPEHGKLASRTIESDCFNYHRIWDRDQEIFSYSSDIARLNSGKKAWEYLLPSGLGFTPSILSVSNAVEVDDGYVLKGLISLPSATIGNRRNCYELHFDKELILRRAVIQYHVYDFVIVTSGRSEFAGMPPLAKLAAVSIHYIGQDEKRSGDVGNYKYEVVALSERLSKADYDLRVNFAIPKGTKLAAGLNLVEANLQGLPGVTQVERDQTAPRPQMTPRDLGQNTHRNPVGTAKVSGTDSDSDPRVPDENGIYWSDQNEDNWVTGMKVVQWPTAVNRKLVIEFLLRNNSPEAREIDVSLFCSNKMSLSLSGGNKASVDIPHTESREKRSAAPNGVLQFKEGRAEISFASLESGEYTLRFGPYIFMRRGVGFIGSGVPFDLSLPVTFDASYDGLPIHWGEPVAGLRLGAMFLGAQKDQVKSFKGNDKAVVQLFVQNVSQWVVDCRFNLPYPIDGWKLHIADSAGQQITGVRGPVDTGLDIQPPPFDSILHPGKRIVSLSGEPQREHAQFAIVPEKPATLRPGQPVDYVLPAGDYTVRCSASFRKAGSPDVTFVMESAPCPFHVGATQGAATVQRDENSS